MLHPVMQRLSREGIDVEEFPQTTGNLTDASQNLYEIIRGRNFIAYPDANIRLAVLARLRPRRAEAGGSRRTGKVTRSMSSSR